MSLLNIEKERLSKLSIEELLVEVIDRLTKIEINITLIEETNNKLDDIKDLLESQR